MLLGRGTTAATKQSPAPHSEEEIFRLNVQSQIKRCNGEVRLIVPSGSVFEQPAQPDTALLKAIARAHGWYEQLISGEVKSLTAIARKMGVTERYVSRILKCAFLAPEIMETILTGRQPAGFTLDRLRANVPIDWAEQRRLLGFSGNSDKSHLSGPPIKSKNHLSIRHPGDGARAKVCAGI